MPMLLCPLTLIITGWIVWDFFGWFSLISVGGLFGMTVLSTYLSNLAEPIQKEKNLITDERIKRTHEIIECIRLIKMYAWEKPLK